MYYSIGFTYISVRRVIPATHIASFSSKFPWIYNKCLCVIHYWTPCSQNLGNVMVEIPITGKFVGNPRPPLVPWLQLDQWHFTTPDICIVVHPHLNTETANNNQHTYIARFVLWMMQRRHCAHCAFECSLKSSLLTHIRARPRANAHAHMPAHRHAQKHTNKHTHIRTHK